MFSLFAPGVLTSDQGRNLPAIHELLLHYWKMPAEKVTKTKRPKDQGRPDSIQPCKLQHKAAL